MRSAVTDDLRSFSDHYFSLVGKTEAPFLYHRWSLYTAIAALLGRQVHFPFGHWLLYPNMYVMLMGNPGARKNSAISIAQKLVERTGYDRFAADKSSKERFLMDFLKEGEGEDTEDLLEMVLDDAVNEQFIVAEEFTDFTGKSNVEFLTMLAKLWDCPAKYRQPKIHGKSVTISQPTTNILAGNTPQAYYIAMPPEAIGQGLMSRLLHVHGEPTGKKITIPPKPDPVHIKAMDLLVAKLVKLKGEMTLGEGAYATLERMYREYPEIEDYRFKHYNSRRFTHLLKLSMVFALTRFTMSIESEDIIYANTLLHYTETKMPTALGEFGKARNADVANAVIDILKTTRQPCTIRYMWKQVAQDLNRIEELQEIVRNLQTSGKIKLVDAGKGLQGYTTNVERGKSWPDELLSPDFLTEEEK